MAINRDKVHAAAAKLLQQGKYDKAIAELQKLVDDDPTDVRTLLKIGDTYVKTGARKESVAAYERAAAIYTDQGFYLKAVAVFKQILRVDANIPDLHLKLAELYQQLGLTSDALQHYQQVAVFYEQQGRARDSLDILKRMVDLDPENIASRIKLGELFAAQGLVAEATVELRSALTFLKGQGRSDDMLRVGERLVAVDPTAVDVAMELAQAYLARNEPKPALGKLEVCFRQDPRNLDTLALISRVFLEMGQSAKGIQVEKEMARILTANGDNARATERWQRVLELAPGDPDAEQALGVVAPKRPAPVAVSGPASATMVPQAAAPAAKPAAVAAAAAAATVPPQAASSGVDDQIARLITETDVYVKYGLKDKALEHLKKVFALKPDYIPALEKLHKFQQQIGGPALVDTLQRLVAAGTAQQHPRTTEWRADLDRIGGALGVAAAAPSRSSSGSRSSGAEVVLIDDESGEFTSRRAGGLSPAPSPPPVDDFALAPDDGGDDFLATAADVSPLARPTAGEVSFPDDPPVLQGRRLDPDSQEARGLPPDEPALHSGLPPDEDAYDEVGREVPRMPTGLTAIAASEQDAGAVDLASAGGPEGDALRAALQEVSEEELLGLQPNDELLLPGDAPNLPGAPADELLLDAPDAPPLDPLGDDPFGEPLLGGAATVQRPRTHILEGPLTQSQQGAPTGLRPYTRVDTTGHDSTSSVVNLTSAEISEIEDLNSAVGDAIDALDSSSGDGLDRSNPLVDALDASEAARTLEVGRPRGRTDVAPPPPPQTDDSDDRRGTAATARGGATSTFETAGSGVFDPAQFDLSADVKAMLASDPSEDFAELEPIRASPAVELAPPRGHDVVAASPAFAEPAFQDAGVTGTGKLGLADKAHGFEDDQATQFFPDELEEAEFFIKQELLDEAKEILAAIAEDVPDSPRVTWMLARIAAKEAGEPEPAAPWEQRILEDVQAQLESLLPDEPAPDAGRQISVDEVLQQFKRGIAETIPEDDAATHYELGNAYRDMGLFDEAINEFEIAARAPSRTADARYLIAMTHAEQGRHQEAVAAGQSALRVEKATTNQRAAAEYIIGTSLIALGRRADAHAALTRAKAGGHVAGDLDAKIREAAADAAAAGTNGHAGNKPPAPAGGRTKNIDYV